jgi:hypothetical protein
MNLSISFKLTGTGWAECEIFVDEKVYVITASYLEDALGNLADAALKIAQGEEFAYAVFAEEPGEYEWKIQRINEKVISIEILWFDDWEGLRQSDDKGRIVLQFECPLLTFIQRIIICLSDVLNKYELEGYKRKWVEHDFPLKTYNELRNIMSKLK